MLSLKREEEPFVEAFADYLNLLTESTYDRVLGRETKTADALKEAGKRLVESAGPPIKEKAKKLVSQMNDLETSRTVLGSLPTDERLRRDFLSLCENSKALVLRKFQPYFEERGLIFDANANQFDSDTFLDVYLGDGTEVESGGIHSIILTKLMTGRTRDRILRGKGIDGFTPGWTVGDKEYYNFEAILGFEKEMWKTFGELRGNTLMPQQVKSGKLAYGEMLKRFAGDERGFCIESGITELVETTKHEFYHRKIVGDFIASRHVEEASANLYGISKAETPGQLFRRLYVIYGLSGGDDTLRRTNAIILEYLGRTGYSESEWSGLDVSDGEKIREVSGKIAKQAKDALKLLERDYGLPSHEDAEVELKPDFEKYGRKVRAAIIGQYEGGGR